MREVWLREERGWRIDLDALAAAVNEKTKLICVCTPNNRREGAHAQRDRPHRRGSRPKHGAWILSDEVYRGAMLDSVESPSFSGTRRAHRRHRWSSKVYGLPGLRRWLVAPETETQAALRLKDYTTIAPRPVPSRWPRSRSSDETSCSNARDSSWANGGQAGRLGDDALPRAALDAAPGGGVCFFSYRFPLESMALVDRLIAELLDDGRPRITSEPNGTFASVTGGSEDPPTRDWLRSIVSSRRWATEADHPLASGESAWRSLVNAQLDTLLAAIALICGVLMCSGGTGAVTPRRGRG